MLIQLCQTQPVSLHFSQLPPPGHVQPAHRVHGPLEAFTPAARPPQLIQLPLTSRPAQVSIHCTCPSLLPPFPLPSARPGVHSQLQLHAAHAAAARPQQRRYEDLPHRHPGQQEADSGRGKDGHGHILQVGLTPSEDTPRATPCIATMQPRTVARTVDRSALDIAPYPPASAFTPCWQLWHSAA